MPPSLSSRIAIRASIRVRVLAATGLLALCGILFAGLGLRNALWEREQGFSLAATSNALATLSRATIELSLERSVSQLSIELPGPVTPEMRRLIDQQRVLADAGLRKVVEQSYQLTGAGRREDFRANVIALQNELTPVRRRFDELTAVPLTARPIETVESLPRDLKAIVVRFQSQRHLLRGIGAMLPTEVAILESIRDQAWQIREFGGRERTYLAIGIATQASINPGRSLEMSVLARRASDAWLDIANLSVHDGLPASLLETIAAVRHDYFGSYDQLRQGLLAQSQLARPQYSITFDEYFRRSSEALAGAEKLARAASESIAAIWTERASTSLRAVAIDAGSVILLMAVAGAAAVAIWSMVRHLDVLRGRMEGLAAGDVDREVPDCDRRNEVGAMARAVLIFRETARERARLEAKAAGEQAERDQQRLSTEMSIRTFTESLAGVMRGLAAASARMEDAAGSMADAAGRTGDLARSTTEDAQNSVQELAMVAAATEKLSANVVEISTQAARAAATADGMSFRAGEAEQTMAGLSEAAGRVGHVAKLICEIADQTNLLALNATIESARAGEAGKGFAVVASEVKQRASRTSSATSEIGAQIGAIQTATEDAVSAVRKMAAEIRDMEEMAAAIAAAVEQQGSGVRNVAGSIASVTRATELAVAAMGESAGAAERARGTSTDVRDAASNVGRESDTLGREVTEFLRVMSIEPA